MGEHHDIFDVAVVGRIDPEWGEVSVSFVVRNPQTDLTESAVMDVLSNSLARFKQPKAVMFLDSFHVTQWGKSLNMSCGKLQKADYFIRT